LCAVLLDPLNIPISLNIFSPKTPNLLQRPSSRIIIVADEWHSARAVVSTQAAERWLIVIPSLPAIKVDRN
jgi:hypothetical protein